MALRGRIGQQESTGPVVADAPERQRPLPGDLRKSIDYIRIHLDGKMSIADLVAHCGVSERTLRKHFRRFMAVSPLKYWRQSRLAAARSFLLKGSSATSVTEVATRFGFGHFSRFAQDYRGHFGEAPSSTLQRSRVGRDERASPSRRRNVGAVAPSSSRDRPSVAVLPLENSSSHADCRAFGEYLAEGMATALCQMRSLTITVPNPSRSWLTDHRRCASDLGARYLLTGRIFQARDRLGVIIRLMDAETDALGRHLRRTNRQSVLVGRSHH